MDDVIRESVKFNVIDSLNNQKIKFNDLVERQNYIDNQINLQIKNLGLDQPWYSPNRFFNTLFKVMFLDLGKSNYFTSDSGSFYVKDIIIDFRNTDTIITATDNSNASTSLYSITNNNDNDDKTIENKFLSSLRIVFFVSSILVFIAIVPAIIKEKR